MGKRNGRKLTVLSIYSVEWNEKNAIKNAKNELRKEKNIQKELSAAI